MIELAYNPVPFDDTFVLYDPTDPLSFLSVLFTLLPIGILIFYVSWFVVTREIEPVLMAGGQVINDILNNIVKNIIKQERPMKIPGFQENGLRSGYGMPSAHSQFIGYFSLYLGLRIWLQWKGLTTFRKSISTIALAVVSFAVVSSRVYLLYHDAPQVIVGLTIGSFVGSSYFVAISILRSIGFIDYLLSWNIVKFFWIKDSTYFEPLSLQQEYEAWKQRRALKVQ